LPFRASDNLDAILGKYAAFLLLDRLGEHSRREYVKDQKTNGQSFHDRILDRQLA
jgi:hypothetical protein